MKFQGIGLVIASALVVTFLISPMMVFAEDFSVIILQGASNRLCATFHNCYSPEEITISVGDSITWVNKDSDFHSVASGKPGTAYGIFDSNWHDQNLEYLYSNKKKIKMLDSSTPHVL